ncbi:MAG: type II restriction endonuclease, partial [Candidatus Brocadiales bacterium]
MGSSEEKQKLKEKFRKQLLKHVELFNAAISTGKGDWVVKGFIDIARNIYTISVDTKVVSKIMELLLFPKVCQFAQDNGYKMVLCKEQNFYPDITFIDSKDTKFAVDLKSTYRKNSKEVNG